MKAKIFLITLGLIGFLTLIFFMPLVVGFGKTGKNTTVLDKDYSLLSKKEILAKLQQDFILPETLTLTTSSREFPLNLSTISVKINYDHLASSLLYRRLNQGISNYTKAFFMPRSFNLEISYDSQQLDQFVNSLNSQISRPFIPSEIVLNNGKVELKAGQIGESIDINQFKSDLQKQLENFQLSSLQIPLTQTGQLPGEQTSSTALNEAQKLIGKSLDISSPDQNITLDDKTLVTWLGFSDNCNQDKIIEYANSLQSSVKKDAVNAKFKVENGKVLEFMPSSQGYSLDYQSFVSLICPALHQLTDNSEKSTKINLPLIYTAPEISTGDVNDLGIKELIGQGSSTFKSSTTIRNYNVEKGASIVNRILVAPGETFSFIKSLGEVTLDAGFKQAYVIRQGKTVLDVGGGICQVSTTLFRAMLNAGLDIIQRQNHAYRVHYYEEDMPPGYDATVFIPNPDLRFVNDTGHYLLIQNTYDGKNKKLTYEIYGTSDGRKVEITNYRQWDASPAPPDVYIDDPTLPPGKVVQDEHRVPGLKTAFDWTVTRGTEVIHQKTYTSNYTPWAAVYRRGPSI